METVRIEYNDRVVRQFLLASVVFGLVGMLVGIIVALQLALPAANLPPLLTFGRLRPLHTNAVIFAFVGNMIFAGIYYSTQRLVKARMASDALSQVHFWGWQAIIVSAAITLPLGITTSKEYAELEWPIDIAIAVIWVVFAINFFWTLAKRKEKHLYVAIWFYIATIITVAVLHIVNSLALPVSLTRSYSIFAGVQDALVQWWYGHNAVAFFLTTPVLGIMYYFVPKASERPVFSYRLSIIHFWSLVFLYIWAGPHHLLYTALPDWAQTLGMIFSLMLWAPSWGGMLNGLLTLRGKWNELRADPVLKFFAAGVTFYGMATFEGPLLSIKSVSGLAHYSDWIIGHVHSGAMGWNGFMAAGMFYWLVPRLWGTKLHSQRAANFHFWIGTFGILLYVIAMWTSGISQGLMWRATQQGGGLLYANFLETLEAIKPMYWMRLIGGLLYITGFIIMTWNLVMTIKSGQPATATAEVTTEEDDEPSVSAIKLIFAPQVIVSILALVLICSVAFLNAVASTLFILIGFVVGLGGILAFYLAKQSDKPTWHALLEGRAVPFTVLTVLAVLIGGVAEIVPAVMMVPEQLRTTQNVPYTALELEGRDVYIREGCYTCHSQMIRPFTWESARYGAPSTPDESVYDHPFQWGSRRIGPDLARVGGKYNDVWHYRHMMNPSDISPGTVMPRYPHLATSTVDFGMTSAKVGAMQTLGVPYTDQQVASAAEDARRDGRRIARGLAADANARLSEDSQLVALIAYLQRLGQPRRNAEGGGAAQHANAATPSAGGAQ